MTINNLVRDVEDRYMDDIRVVLMAIKKGWRWQGEGLYWGQDRQAGETDETRTSKLVLESMNSTLDFLEFTEESPKDFPDGKLPTLDIKFWI